MFALPHLVHLVRNMIIIIYLSHWRFGHIHFDAVKQLDSSQPGKRNSTEHLVEPSEPRGIFVPIIAFGGRLCDIEEE